jgi:hypothetical protein
MILHYQDAAATRKGFVIFARHTSTPGDSYRQNVTDRESPPICRAILIGNVAVSAITIVNPDQESLKSGTTAASGAHLLPIRFILIYINQCLY